MSNGDFRDKVNTKRAEVQQKYYENSDEAWSQVREFFSDPAHWIVAGIAIMLITAGVFTIKFVGAIRAPDVPLNSGDVVTIGDETVSPPVSIGDAEDVIDDSNTVEPMLSGARKDGCYTFLLFGEDKISKSTDTIMVVSYDTKAQKLDLMSIPRDTMVNVSWDIKKINSVYSISGVKGLQKHVGKLIGFVPDYYVRIDLNAFIEIVDLLGGVEFDVPIPMHYHDPAQGLSIDLEPGLQTLDGEQAMGLVRFRKSDRGASGRISGYDDTGRVQTQQAFLRVMFKKCLEVKNWTKITGYVEIFEKNVESDLTLGNMLWFARQAMDLKADGFNTCTIPCNPYASAWSRSTGSMQSYVTLYGKQVVELVNESFNPYLSRVTLSNLDIMRINSDGSVSSSTGYVADSRAAQPVVREKPEETDAAPDEETEEIGAGQDEAENGAENGTVSEGSNETQGGTSGRSGSETASDSRSEDPRTQTQETNDTETDPVANLDPDAGGQTTGPDTGTEGTDGTERTEGTDVPVRTMPDHEQTEQGTTGSDAPDMDNGERDTSGEDRTASEPAPEQLPGGSVSQGTSAPETETSQGPQAVQGSPATDTTSAEGGE